MMEMAKKSRRFNNQVFDCAPVILALQLLEDLNIGPEDARDTHKATAKIAPYFHSEFLASNDGEPFRNSLMFRQEERAKNYPDVRTHISNKMRLPEFFEEVDKEFSKMAHTDDLETLPEEWDLTVRPTIAHRKFFPTTHHLN